MDLVTRSALRKRESKEMEKEKEKENNDCESRSSFEMMAEELKEE